MSPKQPPSRKNGVKWVLVGEFSNVLQKMGAMLRQKPKNHFLWALGCVCVGGG